MGATLLTVQRRIAQFAICFFWPDAEHEAFREFGVALLLGEVIRWRSGQPTNDTIKV